MKVRPLAKAGIFATLLILLGSVASSGELFIYPKAGQSDEQQTKDKYECIDWSTKQTNFDPMNPPPPPDLNTAQVTRGGAVRGAARGAAGGAVA